MTWPGHSANISIWNLLFRLLLYCALAILRSSCALASSSIMRLMPHLICPTTTSPDHAVLSHGVPSLQDMPLSR